MLSLWSFLFQHSPSYSNHSSCSHNAFKSILRSHSDSICWTLLLCKTISRKIYDFGPNYGSPKYLTCLSIVDNLLIQNLFCLIAIHSAMFCPIFPVQGQQLLELIPAHYWRGQDKPWTGSWYQKTNFDVYRLYAAFSPVTSMIVYSFLSVNRFQRQSANEIMD